MVQKYYPRVLRSPAYTNAIHHFLRIRLIRRSITTVFQVEHNSDLATDMLDPVEKRHDLIEALDAFVVHRLDIGKTAFPLQQRLVSNRLQGIHKRAALRPANSPTK